MSWWAMRSYEAGSSSTPGDRHCLLYTVTANGIHSKLKQT
jgi:hypothetical protein